MTKSYTILQRLHITNTRFFNIWHLTSGQGHMKLPSTLEMCPWDTDVAAPAKFA